MHSNGNVIYHIAHASGGPIIIGDGEVLHILRGTLLWVPALPMSGIIKGTYNRTPSINFDKNPGIDPKYLSMPIIADQCRSISINASYL